MWAYVVTSGCWIVWAGGGEDGEAGGAVLWVAVGGAARARQRGRAVPIAGVAVGVGGVGVGGVVGAGHQVVQPVTQAAGKGVHFVVLSLASR